MTKYRKKPVVIDAILNTGDTTKIQEFLRETAPTLMFDHVALLPFGVITIPLEGEMRCDVGDWLIRGIKGELYPCKPDIFDATYELADGKPLTYGDLSEKLWENHERNRMRNFAARQAGDPIGAPTAQEYAPGFYWIYDLSTDLEYPAEKSIDGLWYRCGLAGVEEGIFLACRAIRGRVVPPSVEERVHPFRKLPEFVDKTQEEPVETEDQRTKNARMAAIAEEFADKDTIPRECLEEENRILRLELRYAQARYQAAREQLTAIINLTVPEPIIPHADERNFPWPTTLR